MYCEIVLRDHEAEDVKSPLVSVDEARSVGMDFCVEVLESTEMTFNERQDLSSSRHWLARSRRHQDCAIGRSESIRTLHINILFPPTRLIRAIQFVRFDGRLLPPRCLCGPVLHWNDLGKVWLNH